MDANSEYILIVFNTCTQKYEEVTVSAEVYRTYNRTNWNIRDNNDSFFAHEIQLSSLIGAQDCGYENFHEFIDAVNTPENIILKPLEKRPCTMQSRPCLSQIRHWCRAYFLRVRVKLNIQKNWVFHSLQYINERFVF